MSIKALKQKRADLVKEGDALFVSAEKENRALTADEARKDDEISAALLDLNAQIERLERNADRMRALEVGPLDANTIVDRMNSSGRQNGEGGFTSFGAQLLSIMEASLPGGQRDPRLQVFNGISAATGANESIGSEGGFLVQTDYAGMLIENTFNSGEIANRVTRLPIGANSNGMTMNGVDETSRVNGSRQGGIQVYWTGEAQQYTKSKPSFKRIKMELDKLTGLIYVTDEMLQDSTFLEAWIAQAFPKEFTFKVEDAVMQGTGSGAPLGWLNSSALITVNKEASQVAATIVSENILNMWARMPAASRSKAVWYVNQDIEPQLYQMNAKIKNVAGTENVGGIQTPQVIFNPPGTNGNALGTLMGRPVIPVEYAATLGTVGDIQLVDPSQYLMIDKGGITSQSSIHVRFEYGETAFRFTYRANGGPLANSAITPYKGTNTQSPFIVLQTR